jgi:hypothetical protein
MLHLALVSLTAIGFAGAGAFNMVGTAATQADFARWGYPRGWWRVTGLLELIAGALIAWPQTRQMGLVLGAAIILAAAATVVRNRDFSHLTPIAVFIVLLAGTAALAGS